MWDLFDTGVRVLRTDRELLVFPALVMAAGIAAGAFVWMSDETILTSVPDVLLLASVFGCFWLFRAYMEASLIASAAERLSGGDPNIRFGVWAAGHRLPQVLLWSVISFILGVPLMIVFFLARHRNIDPISERVSRPNVTSLGIIGMLVGWHTITFLSAPAAVLEGAYPVRAIRRSLELVRGDGADGAHLSFVASLFMILCMFVAYFAWGVSRRLDPLVALGVGWGCLLIGLTISFTLLAVSKAAVYDHATGANSGG